MKNRISMYGTAALLLILAILLAGMSAAAEGGVDNHDLANFLYRIEIAGAEKNEAGAYVIVEGVPYTIQMYFSEKTNGLQFPEDGVLTYRFPDGFTPSHRQEGTVEMTGDGGVVWFDYVIDGGVLTITFDPTSPGYSSFNTSEDAKFEIHTTGVISQESIQFSSEVSGTFYLDEDRKVSVQKTGDYDGDLNRVKFTIQAYSKGNNTDVHIGDIISGTALSYDPSTLTVSSNLQDPVPYNEDVWEGETFGLTIDSMSHGETVTVEYYADVDLSVLTGVENGAYDTVELTGNKVMISSHEDGPPHDPYIITDGDFQNRIALSTNSKTALSQQVRDGKTYVTWKIVLNENANISIAGKSVTDTIEAASQQFMSYSGTGIHIEKYLKDGTLAGTSDVRWGTNGLILNESSWTYTIPEADAEQNYRYVITYETEVDSDTFLKTTDVSNTVENEYDTDWGTASVGTTGEEVEAAKSAVESVVDKEHNDAQTEWEITFTVPTNGLDSAEIIDSLPGFLNVAEHQWYYDAYVVDSARVKEGDLLPGEAFAVTSGPEDHQVVISFTKDYGEESGLTGTGLTRTIHVYLTTRANRDWLEHAESETRARTHVNNAVVWVNGQDIHVTSSVSYNTTEYELEKRLEEGSYSTNTDDPPLPIYVYRITLTNLSEDAFDQDGYMTIIDEYDPEYLVYNRRYSTDYSNEVNDPNGFIYGNSLWDKYGRMEGRKGDYVVDESSSTPGQLVFKFSKQDIPMNGTTYWPYYAIFYALQIKDAETLADMKEQALHADGLKVDLVNSVRNNLFGSDTIVTEYSVDALIKKKVGEEDNAGTGTHDIRFQIDVNPDGLKIGDEETITVKDTLSNLSFDYTSIAIDPQLEGDILNRVGNSIVFTLHNETPYIITYTSRLIGLNDVEWNNKAELYGYTSGVSGTSSWESGGSGSYRTYSMNVMKYAEGNMNDGLAARFKLYEARVKDSYGVNIPEPEWKEVLEFVTDETTGIYEIKTVHRDGITEEQSLRPYSYHDADGNEQFGNDGSENYGWRYHIKEITPPEGYQKTEVVYEFGISDIPRYTAPYNYLNNDTVTIVNKPVPALVEAVIPGTKILVGKELENQEFTFSLSPEESVREAWGEAPYPGGFSGSLTAKNDEEGRFHFPLTFTYEDYLNAVAKGYIDENQAACFYYVVKEELPEGVEDYFWNGVKYDEARFLVRVKLFVSGNQLTTETGYYPYDGSGIPEEAP